MSEASEASKAAEASGSGSPRATHAAGAGGGATSLPGPAAWPVERLRERLFRPFALQLFFLRRLPLALVAGLRIPEVDRWHCVVTVPYGWRTTNPFRSTYFAALSMAAELSTGALAMLATGSAPAPVALLITALEGGFDKKATAPTTFTCTAGDEIFAAVAAALASGEATTVRAETIGRNPDGVVVARFVFTWSFKRRTPRAAG